MRLIEVALDEVQELQPLIEKRLDAIEDGLRPVVGQLPVGPAGRPDILAVGADGGLALIELKAVEADVDAILQILRYYDWLSRNVALVARPFPDFRPDQGIRSILIAPEFSSDLQLLSSYLQESLQLSLWQCQPLKDVESGQFDVLLREIGISPAHTKQPQFRSFEDIVGYITDEQVRKGFTRVVDELRGLPTIMQLESGGRWRSIVFIANDVPIAYLQTRQKFFRCWVPPGSPTEDKWPVYRCSNYEEWSQQCREAITRYAFKGQADRKRHA